MAKDDNSNKASNRRLRKTVDRLNMSMNSLYRNTYSSREDNRDNTDKIINSIDDNIDSILNRVNDQSVSNIASLYVRAQEKEMKQMAQVNKELESLFDSSGAIIGSLNTDLVRKSIQAQDYQYRTLLRYMPKLMDALNIKKDNVLSSDSFTKDCFSITTDHSGRDYLLQFSDQVDQIKERYNIEEKIDEIYMDTSIYGEYFLYHVPYKKAFERLLRRRDQYGAGIGSGNVVRDPRLLKVESDQSIFAKPLQGTVVYEWSSLKEDYKAIYNIEFSRFIDPNMKVTLEFDDSGIIESALTSVEAAQKIVSQHQSVFNEFYSGLINEANNGDGPKKAYMYNGLSQDGFITTTKGKSDADKIRDDINGSVMWKIPRDQIIPLYMGETNVGYLYLEVDNQYLTSFTQLGNQYNSIGMNTELTNDEWDRQNDLLVNQIATTISTAIDAKFINNNLDLKQDIYAVLRYNDKFTATAGSSNIRCTFLPSEDVQHFYFRLDPKTHRGISDLDRAVIPGMIWCMAYLNDAIARMSRGSDKRVYYVQQTIEKNVAKTLLNVVDQLKKGNMGMRQLENMNAMFNVLGKFNDHVIPVGANGESPIRMEVLNGQQIDTPTDLMDRMEEAAIYTTDVPPEFINSINQVDYAIRFTMSNASFLKKIQKRQMICQRQYSIFFRKLYNYEYDTIDNTIKLNLPLPAYLATINSTQLLENAQQYANGVANLMLGDDAQEGLKEEFVRLYSRKFLSTYIDFDECEELIEQARVNLEGNKEEESFGDGDESDDF